MSWTNRATKSWFWATLLFVLALAPRLPGLRLFLTTDEPFFVQEAATVLAALLRGDFRGTYWHFYPGVTLSWLSGLGLLTQWALANLFGPNGQPLEAYFQRELLDLIVGVRLPHALLTAAGVAGFYLLARRLLGHRTALLGALLIGLDPFYLAHSRVAHGDAPLTVFMGLSALAFLVHLQATSPEHTYEVGKGEGTQVAGARQWLIFSAVMGALAALTKAPGQFMAPFVLLVGAGNWLITSWRARRVDWRLARRWLVDLIIWGSVAACLFVVLWPAMWVDPVGTLVHMLGETFGKVEEGHLVFFMGQPTLKPGPWFYPYVVPLRLTPVTLIGVLASALVLVARLRALTRNTDQASLPPAHYGVAVLLWIFAVSLLFFGSLSPKKQDRYLLPLFPILAILAAFALVSISESASQLITKRVKPGSAGRDPQPIIRSTILSVLVLWQAFPVLAAYPYYLAYFNPLMGGLSRAVETTLVGWGEGMEQAAAYLNQRPDADELTVASVPAQTFLPFFRGEGENFYTNDVALRADYVVLYVSQLQRLAPSPEVIRYFWAMEPERTIYIRGVPYVWIYPGPKFIVTDLPPEATRTNISFTDRMQLAGYQVSRSGSAISDLETVLYWHALSRVDADFTISVRLVASDGTWLAQHDSWPVGGLLPTSQWRPGDYVRDRHALNLPAEATPGEYAIQIVVYDAATGVALNEPRTVATFVLEAMPS